MDSYKRIGPIRLKEAVNRLVRMHGGLRAAARKIELSASYLGRLRDGGNSNPSKITLGKLELRKIPYYKYTTDEGGML